MEVIKEYLLEHGYETDHPDRVLCRFYKTNNKNPEWRVSVEQEYLPLSNNLSLSSIVYLIFIVYILFIISLLYFKC